MASRRGAQKLSGQYVVRCYYGQALRYCHWTTTAFVVRQNGRAYQSSRTFVSRSSRACAVARGRANVSPAVTALP